MKQTVECKNPGAPKLIGLMICALVCLCGMKASAQDDWFWVSVDRQAYYEAYDTVVSASIDNTSGYTMTVLSLSAADSEIYSARVSLEPGESAQFSTAIHVDDNMLSAGQFYVTLKYELNGVGAAVAEKKCDVKRLEDKVEARILFSLPEVAGQGELIPVDYILENCGETDMANAVIICYPESWFSSPRFIPAGSFISVRRLVSAEELKLVRAEATFESVYSGTVFSASAKYEGDMPPAVSIENEVKDAPAEADEAKPFAYEPPALNAESENGGIVINVFSGSAALEDIKIYANGDKRVRTLAYLGAGTDCKLFYEPQEDGIYTFSMIAKSVTGEEVSALSGETEYRSQNGEKTRSRGTGLVDAIVNARWLTKAITYMSLAGLAVLAGLLLIKHRRGQGKGKDV